MDKAQPKQCQCRNYFLINRPNCCQDSFPVSPMVLGFERRLSNGRCLGLGLVGKIYVDEVVGKVIN